MENQNTNQQISSNQQYVQNSTFMIMRVDTTDLLKRLENFLSATKVVIEKSGDVYIEKEISIGKPIANTEGVLRICNMVNLKMNAQVVQANIKEDHYLVLLDWTRREVTHMIVNKCYDWDIDDSDLMSVIDEVMCTLELYWTRCINDGERKSYNYEVRANEQVISNQGGGLFGFWGKKNA